VKNLQTHVLLPFAFNIRNTVQISNDLDQNLRLASFDISNIYTNITTDELLTIIELACKNNDVEKGMKRDILKILKFVIDQNYFQFMDQTYVYNTIV
jgi:hypothetical protein